MTMYLVVGTRPQIIKSASIIHKSIELGLDMEIIHTGQHYDPELSQIFLEELSIPVPVVNLGVGSGTHIFQITEIMLRLEKYLRKHPASMIIVPGDTNSALASALASHKIGTHISHVEAGPRCYNMRLPEEVNRRIIDHCSDILFAPTDKCMINLKNESVIGECFLTGDVMYDVFLQFSDRVDECDILDKYDLDKEEYILLTLHRSENVDSPSRIRDIITGIQKSGERVIFPRHPRTRSRMVEYGISLQDSNIRAVDPVSYVEILTLLRHSSGILTDSGGLQKEAFWSKIPCITLRDETEWTETIEMGVNSIAGADSDRITHAIGDMRKRNTEIRSKFKKNPFGDGEASRRIIEILRTRIGDGYNEY